MLQKSLEGNPWKWNGVYPVTRCFKSCVELFVCQKFTIFLTFGYTNEKVKKIEPEKGDKDIY